MYLVYNKCKLCKQMNPTILNAVLLISAIKQLHKCGKNV